MGELSWAAIRQARGVPPALDVRSGTGSVRLVDAESRCVLMTWPVAQWCPAGGLRTLGRDQLSRPDRGGLAA